MFKNLLSLFALASAFSVAGAQSDYLNATPPTIYEAEEMSPQNMDFDSENNMFVAHAGWYKDHLVHYYKFRIFAPVTYPGVVEPGSTSAAVPLQKVYIVTDSGDFTGMIGMPIIEYHTQDGLMYSDFMTVTFVEAPTDYVEGTFKSTGDIMASGATLFETDIVLNLPVVPTGSTLQHPIEMGTSKAPINPIPVYYRGVEVWTYLFEVTDQAAADAFASTRSPDVSPERQEGETTGFEIPVVSFATSERVSAIPLWHVNQFRNGVMEGNGGGPDPMGMRNVIDMDRPDPGYSPLWQLYWATETPINFTADEFSNAAQGTSSNGFMFFETPMFVNCPDIGMVGEESNPLKAEEFMSMIYLDSGDSFMIIGSDASLIMTADVEVTLMADDGTTLATVQTGMLGGYEFSIMKDDIPEGTMELMVMVGEETIRSIEVEDMMDEEPDDEEPTPVGTVELTWRVPTDGMSYEPMDVVVGDTIVWNFDGVHTVYFYPSMSCDDDTDAVMIGDETGTSYTFQEADGSPEGTEHFIVCTVGGGSHCNAGQNLLVTVFSKSEDDSEDDEDGAFSTGGIVGLIFSIAAILF